MVQRGYRCPQCPQTFTTAEARKAHVNAAHPGFVPDSGMEFGRNAGQTVSEIGVDTVTPRL